MRHYHQLVYYYPYGRPTYSGLTPYDWHLIIECSIAALFIVTFAVLFWKTARGQI